MSGKGSSILVTIFTPNMFISFIRVQYTLFPCLFPPPPSSSRLYFWKYEKWFLLFFTKVSHQFHYKREYIMDLWQPSLTWCTVCRIQKLMKKMGDPLHNLATDRYVLQIYWRNHKFAEINYFKPIIENHGNLRYFSINDYLQLLIGHLSS